MAELEKKDFEKRNAIRKILINAFNRLSETNIDIIFKEIVNNMKHSLIQYHFSSF